MIIIELLSLFLLASAAIISVLFFALVPISIIGGFIYGIITHIRESVEES